MQLLEQLSTRFPEIPVVMLTAHGTVKLAVDAMKLGAADFVLKPFDRTELLFVVNKALRSTERVRSQAPASPQRGLVGDSAAMVAVRLEQRPSAAGFETSTSLQARSRGNWISIDSFSIQALLVAWRATVHGNRASVSMRARLSLGLVPHCQREKNMNHAPLYAFAVCSFVMACGSDDGTDAENATGPGVSDTGSCSVSSGFPGDDLCILPPAPGEGIQLHAGPANYSDPDVLAPWIIEGGDEDVRCYLVRVPESGFYYLRQQNRMRSGSHHMLIGLVADQGQPEGPANCDSLGSLGSIPGSQIPKRDFPDQLAPEDAGLARYLPEGAMASFQMHYVNTTKEPLLREAWVNLYRLEESEVRQRLQSVFLVADIALNIPANTRQTVTQEFAPTLSEPTRIFQLNAHMHAHTESFSVWRLRGDQRELIYKSFDWAEPDILTYNTVVDNPPPDDTAKRDGGLSGLLYLEPGDRLQWSCDVNNTLSQAMGFANEAYTAEMCLLAGSYVSDMPGLFAGACANGACFSRMPGGN